MVAGAAHGCAASSWASRANGNQAQHRQGVWSVTHALQAAHTCCYARLMPGHAHSARTIAVLFLFPCLMHAHVPKNRAPIVNVLHADPAAQVFRRCTDVARCTQERGHAL